MPAKERREVNWGEKSGVPDWTRMNQAQQIRVDLIHWDPKNPRSVGDEQKFQRLVRSIKRLGILVPLVGRKGDRPDRVILRSGHRRLDAARLLHLRTVPVLLVDKNLSESEIREALLAYNLQEPVPPLDQAKLVLDEANETGSSIEDVSEDWCLDPVEMKQCAEMRTSLAASVQREVNLRTISVEAGYLISRISPKADEQKAVAKRYLSGVLSLAGLRRLATPKAPPKPKVQKMRLHTENVRSSNGAARDGAEYVYKVPSGLLGNDVEVHVKCARGLSERSLRQVLEHVIKTFLHHPDEES